MLANGFAEARAEIAEPHEIGPGVTFRSLWRSGPESSARQALVIDFEPHAAWPGVDVHEPGPEDLYIVSGTFIGLTGSRSVHEAGTFVHCEAGTSHSPTSPTGGLLFVYFPEG
jgi:hypothetical protein